jgi:BirA family biotin operon repressor/biotin-[acetyl-CoA-carboxylase] ligase
VTGLALAEATQRACGIGISLKWPNDLLYIEKKIGGILCESASQGSQVSTCVVGFGLNVNGRETDFPEELRSLATSCLQATHRFYDRNGLIADIFNQLENWYDCVISEQFEHVQRSYEASCVTLGREVEIACLAGQTIRGTATTIGQDGTLLVSTMREGKSQTLEIRSGDVHHLR